MDISTPVTPYPKNFPELLEDYCRQIQEAKRRNSHHDQRRALFMDFYRKGFGVEPEEVELEEKVKVAEVRGYIDALFHVTILEFKSNLEKERPAGESELRLYLKSRPNPADYIAAITDGEVFEVYRWEEGQIAPFDSFALHADQPLNAYLKLDQFRTSEKRRQPSSEAIVIRFGPHSAVYQQAMSLMRKVFDEVEKGPTVATKFREWNRLLAKVYGAEVDDAELFLTHTYLVVLSRLMVAQALFPKDKRHAALYRGIMTGEVFTRKRLPNLAEPDFFSWALDTAAEDHFIGLIGRIERYVGVYDFGTTEEDILKELYQGLVDPADRHDLGEYYTPDWLAELTLDRIGYQGGSLLDPSCGSGTFLMCAVRLLRQQGLAKDKLVEAAVENLHGIDVHPLAVLMAKANLLLALGADARAYKKQLRLPVFMADTLQTELDERKGYLKVPAAKGSDFHIPLATIEDHPDLIDTMIEEMQQFAHVVAEQGADLDAAKAGFLKKFPHLTKAGNGEAFFWKQDLETAVRLIRQKKDSIWAFLLKNTYRPTFLRKQKVACVVGNPPWLSYHYIRDEDYKKRIRALCFDYELLKPDQRALITQIELATIFYRHCERHFLKPGGKIGLVLPWGAMGGAKQHEAFQQQGGFAHAMDFHQVTGVFNVPCCVMISGEVKKGAKPTCEYFKGAIDRRNPRWQQVKGGLRREESALTFVTHRIRSPWYHEVALQGATIVPRSFYFVEKDPNCADVREAPYLRTSRETMAESKKPWNRSEAQIAGQIEKQYLFYTMLAKGLLPFGIRRVEPIALPIKLGKRSDVELVDSNAMLETSHIKAMKWMSYIEKVWDTYSKNEKMSIYDRLNFNSLMSNQSTRSKTIVLYNKSGTNLTAAVHRQGQFRVANGIPVSGFIADFTTYTIHTDSLGHADYLCAILNSEPVMEAIKETMPKGLMGERDIHRRPFEVCEIPLFDPKNELHQRIATLGEICRKKAEKIAPKIEGPVGKARQTMRAYLAEEIHEINRLVAELLKSSSGKPQKRPTFDDRKKPEFFDA
jgi:hypothetical protein